MSSFDDEIRRNLKAIGGAARPADLAERSLRTARALRRRRAAAAMTAVVVTVAGIAVGGWTLAGGRGGGVVQPIGSPSSVVAGSPSAGITSDADPPPTAPGVETSGAATVEVSVPVTFCPTSHGGGEPTAAPTPTARSLRVPVGLSSSLAVFSDDEGWLWVVAPKNWHCVANDANDGGSEVIALPQTAPLPDWRTPTPELGEEIHATDTGACLLCGYGRACPILVAPSAANGPCASGPPADETGRVFGAVPRYYEFTDPAGVAGTAPRSDYPVLGLMSTDPSTMRTRLYTCALPAAQTALCQAVIDVHVPDGTASPTEHASSSATAPSGGSTDVTCATVDSAAGNIAPNHSTRTASGAPPDTVTTLATYSDAQGRITVEAPANWQCAAHESSAGTLSLIVVPPGTSTAPPKPFTRDGREAVSVILASPGSQEVFDLSCATIPRKTVEACPWSVPASEKESLDTNTVAEFDDPAGVVGDGAPSGGRFYATGRVVYRPAQGSTPDDAALLTCTLADGEANVCDDVILAFAPFGVTHPIPGG